MNPVEVLRFALRGMSSNKLRSGLTTLGILIGVAAVILLVAVGAGASQAIERSIQGLGTDSVRIMPSRPATAGTAARALTMADATALADPQGAPDVRAVAPVVTASSTTLVAGSVSTTVNQLVGTVPAYFDATDSPLEAGSAITDADLSRASKVLVLGRTVADTLFGAGSDPIGRQVLVSNVPYTVAGVLAAKGGTGLADADDTVVAPLTTVQGTLTGYGSLAQIVVRATSADAVPAVQAEVGAILDQRHHVESTAAADYRVVNPTQLLATRTAAVDTFTVLLASVAAISLLVGGIGITNIMLVTVTERIREIGIRKAVGASRGAVLGQFLAEATLLSLFGGALGVLIGVLGSRLTIAGIEPVIVPSSVLLAFGVSAAIGLFFGSYPASRAARLRPIEALRHE